MAASNRVQIWVSVGECCTEDALFTFVDDVEASPSAFHWAESEAVKQQGRKDIHCIEVHEIGGKPKTTGVIHRFGRSGRGWERLGVKCPEPPPGE